MLESVRKSEDEGAQNFVFEKEKVVYFVVILLLLCIEFYQNSVGY
jgi:hypothetical protein